MEWLVVVGFVVAAGVGLMISAARLRRMRAERDQTCERVVWLEAQVTRLRPYERIVDAEAHAAAMGRQAEDAAQAVIARAHAEVVGVVEQAAHEAAERKAETARASEQVLRRASEKESKAVALLAEASVEANRVIIAAQARAEVIAGDAYKAMRDARQYEEAARAMRNVVEGYGDRYVVPTAGLLDALAEELGFTEAGQRLAVARERTRAMVNAGTAAGCDYVEAGRRETAIRFVLDAFNGKVDTVLSDVKSTNHGTIERKIRDVISNVGSFGEDVYKIGLTRRLEPMDRIRELGDASVPFDFDVHALIRSDDAPALERELQRRFVRQQVNKVNARKEFFRVSLTEVRDAVASLGCAATFTLTAAATEWKETRAIEREMARGTFDRAAWERRQIAEHDGAVPGQLEAVEG